MVVEAKPASHVGAVVAVVVILIVGSFVLFTPQGQSLLNQGFHIFPSSSSSSSSSSSGSSSSATTATSSTVPCAVSRTVTSLVAPDIHGNQASVWYPSDYCTLASYALSLINLDRAANGTTPVTLGFNLAAQQHVDSMLYYGYFSHNDTQGYKPYMRYSFLGGRGADFENIATVFNSQFSSTADVQSAIKDLEDSMVNNDLTCCSNLHKENILDHLHTQVSIGVAYDGSTVYFGEEFENIYVDLTFATVGGCTASSTTCQVTMKGTSLNGGMTSKTDAVFVAYDTPPMANTPVQLNAGPREYGPGKLVGGALPPCNPLIPPGCSQFSKGVTVYADKWSTGSQFDIEFALQDFIQNYGAGVYTIYVVTGPGTNYAITTISVLVS